MTRDEFKPGAIIRAKKGPTQPRHGDIRHYEVQAMKLAFGEHALREIGGTTTFFVNTPTDEGFKATTILLGQFVVINVAFEDLETVHSVEEVVKYINNIIK